MLRMEGVFFFGKEKKVVFYFRRCGGCGVWLNVSALWWEEGLGGGGGCGCGLDVVCVW